MSDATTPTPPGWYADPNVPGGQRWWDGGQWTEHAQVPYSAAAAAMQLKAPEGTKTDTVWAWLIVLLPLLSIGSLFLIDIPGYMRAILADPTSPTATLGLYTSPGYLITTLSGFVFYGLTVVFAALDVRALTQRQVPKPFHWAFAFLGGLVYIIGRSVVVRRRTGGGLGPLWGMIAVYVVSVIVSVVWTVMITQQIIAMMPSYIPH